MEGGGKGRQKREGEEGLMASTIKENLAQGCWHGHLHSRTLPLSHLCYGHVDSEKWPGAPPAQWEAQTQHRSSPTRVAEAPMLGCTCPGHAGQGLHPGGWGGSQWRAQLCQLLKINRKMPGGRQGGKSISDSSAAWCGQSGVAEWLRNTNTGSRRCGFEPSSPRY